MFRKLKRTWSHNDINYIPNLRQVFPELNKLSSEELCDRFRKLKLDFYHEEKTPVKPLVRLTLPFALILYILMFIFLPLKFIISGTWYYGAGGSNKILNWFRMLKL